MADDVEARLRAALRAHADLVEEPTDDAVPAGPAPGRRRWGAVLLAAATAAVVGGSVWLATDRPGEADRTTAAASDVPAAASDDGSAAAAASLAPGVPFDLYTHCGVLGADLDGSWFAADPPLVEEFGPPEGWGNPYQPGTLTRLSPSEAVFTDAAGHEVRLRADESARPPACA